MISVQSYDAIRALGDHEPTPRQREILRFIRSFIHDFGYPPTMREIGAAFGIASTNGVTDHLKALVRRGKLKVEFGKSRAIKVLDGPCPLCGGGK